MQQPSNEQQNNTTTAQAAGDQGTGRAPGRGTAGAGSRPPGEHAPNKQPIDIGLYTAIAAGIVLGFVTTMLTITLAR